MDILGACGALDLGSNPNMPAIFLKATSSNVGVMQAADDLHRLPEHCKLIKKVFETENPDYSRYFFGMQS